MPPRILERPIGLDERPEKLREAPGVTLPGVRPRTKPEKLEPNYTPEQNKLANELLKAVQEQHDNFSKQLRTGEVSAGIHLDQLPQEIQDKIESIRDGKITFKDKTSMPLPDQLGVVGDDNNKRLVVLSAEPVYRTPEQPSVRTAPSPRMFAAAGSPPPAEPAKPKNILEVNHNPIEKPKDPAPAQPPPPPPPPKPTPAPKATSKSTNLTKEKGETAEENQNREPAVLTNKVPERNTVPVASTAPIAASAAAAIAAQEANKTKQVTSANELVNKATTLGSNAVAATTAGHQADQQNQQQNQQAQGLETFVKEEAKNLTTKVGATGEATIHKGKR